VSTIRHHLPDDLLASYASGTAPDALALLAACHATLCPRCRAEIAVHESIGSSLLETAAPAGLDQDAMLSGLLDRLDEPDPTPIPQPAPPCPVLPAALARRIGPFQALSWTRVVPGVRKVELELDGFVGRMLQFRPGLNLMEHRHSGTERGLVLAGGFTDKARREHFERGDVSLRGAEEPHRVRIDKGTPCTTLFIDDGPLLFDGALGRVAAALLNR
jgi:putative transcriptional regulator